MPGSINEEASMAETLGEANARLACLNCGASGGQAFRLADGRVVRACRECLRGDGICEWARGEVVFEVAGADAAERKHQWCRCAMCGVVERCTPSNDFYGQEGEGLVCERCVLKKHKIPGPLIHALIMGEE
jgi:hypothetical protein